VATSPARPDLSQFEGEPNMRLKIIAGNLAVVVLLGLAAFIIVGGQLRGELLKRLDNNIGNDRELFERSFRLSALEFVDLVNTRAGEPQLRDVFGGLDLESKRKRAFEAAESTAAWLSDPARGGRGGPDIVVIVDETGKALARNGAVNVMFGKVLLPQLPALSGVLESGRAAHDVWLEDQQKKVLQTAMAPIRAAESGNVLGALIVGYDLSNGIAQREAKVLRRDVAFVTEGNIYSSSLEGGSAKALQGYLFGPAAASTNAILGGQSSTSQIWSTSLEGSEYIGVTSRLPMAPSLPVAFAVLGNRTAQLEVVSVVNVILIMMVLGALLVVAYGFVIGNAVMRPIEQIEEGVLAVINGRTDIRLEIQSAELGGLAFRINQLLNVFTGTEEGTEDEQGRVSMRPKAGDWKDAAFADAPAAGGAASGGGAINPDEPIDDPALAARLAAESEASYNQRVYDEYAAAKQALGESVANIPAERFAQRLSGRAAALAKKHGCRLVRFQVESRDGQVLLRPVLIN
jgi:hypothetical protein